MRSCVPILISWYSMLTPWCRWSMEPTWFDFAIKEQSGICVEDT